MLLVSSLMIHFLTVSDVDECSESTSCDQNAFCINTDGSFNCMCMKGYSGNGTHCLGTYIYSELSHQ